MPWNDLEVAIVAGIVMGITSLIVDVGFRAAWHWWMATRTPYDPSAPACVACGRVGVAMSPYEEDGEVCLDCVH